MNSKLLSACDFLSDTISMNATGGSKMPNTSAARVPRALPRQQIDILADGADRSVGQKDLHDPVCRLVGVINDQPSRNSGQLGPFGARIVLTIE